VRLKMVRVHRLFSESRGREGEQASFGRKFSPPNKKKLRKILLNEVREHPPRSPRRSLSAGRGSSQHEMRQQVYRTPQTRRELLNRRLSDRERSIVPSTEFDPSSPPPPSLRTAMKEVFAPVRVQPSSRRSLTKVMGAKNVIGPAIDAAFRR